MIVRAIFLFAVAVLGVDIGQVVFSQAITNENLVLGSVDFPTSGSEEAQGEFVVGVLALHNFWYEEARDHFIQAQALDSTFGMAYWGEAMTYDNAFRTTQGEENEELGTAVIARMDQLDLEGKLKWTEREQGYANAVRWRFAATPFEVRRRDYAEAMEQLSLRYPEDDEATIFAVLALMALPGFDRENPSHTVTVVSRFEEIYERNREHPGVLHYLIHAYDTETFALMGLRQARRYAEIAPASSHALHMPSHIFRLLGMWSEVAASNEDAYQASVRWQERTGRPLHTRDFHALDWLLDAYLRLSRFEDAKRLMDELDKIELEIRRGGEEWGEFPNVAGQLREYYRGAVPSG